MSQRGSVLVTGASTGIGEACARALDKEGFRVFAGVRRDADAERLRAGTRIEPVRLDVTDAATIAGAAATVDRAVGDAGLAGLVNNAGIAVAGPLEYLPLEQLRRQLEVNVVGVVAVTQAMLPALRRATGRIVVIGSISGRLSNALLGPYSASKFAVEALCDAWRAELAPWGLEVALVEPGEIATPIWDKGLEAGDALAAGMPVLARERYGRAIAALQKVARGAARRGAPPDSVARAVLHALTTRRPRTRYIVGRDAVARAWIARLPDRWRDALIRKAMGLPGAPDAPR
jgi:NAD(P)-dependent dehydrogenase (short-subunit alcohol dehydrogenase family)